jgi:hypothetical protein
LKDLHGSAGDHSPATAKRPGVGAGREDRNALIGAQVQSAIVYVHEREKMVEDFEKIKSGF